MIAHLKPQNVIDNKADAKEIARLIESMGYKPEDVYFRFISKNKVDTAAATGTDRDTTSISHNDDYGRGTSTSYESLAMKKHGVYDKSYTSYLSDGASLTRPDAGYTLNLDSSAVLIYRKDPEIVSVDPYKYIKVGESPGSFGFHIFKKHPSNFLVGAISASGLDAVQNMPPTTGKHTHEPEPPLRGVELPRDQQPNLPS